MRNKKLKLLALVVSLITLTSTQVFATSTVIIPTVVENTAKVAEKSFQPKPISTQITVLATSSTPMWYVKSTLYVLGGTVSTSDSFTDSTKAKRYAIDHIYAKTKYYVESSLKGSAQDEQYNNSHAGAECQRGTIYTGDAEVYGNHLFEHKGYQSWSPETYDT